MSELLAIAAQYEQAAKTYYDLYQRNVGAAEALRIEYQRQKEAEEKNGPDKKATKAKNR